MKTIAVLLLTTAVASAITVSDPRVKWSLLDPFQIFNSYHELPNSMEAAVDEGWVEINIPNEDSLTLYCFPDDSRFCLILDSYGNIAGVQKGFLKSDILDKPGTFDPSEVFTSEVFFGQDVWITSVYFQDPGTLLAGNASEAANSTAADTEIWFETVTGIVPGEDTVNSSDSAWIEEPCVDGIGTRAYYNTSTSLECGNFQPWSLIFGKNGTLIGFEVHAPRRETVTLLSSLTNILSFLQPTSSQNSQCPTDLVAKYGMIYTPFYFSSDLSDTSC